MTLVSFMPMALDPLAVAGLFVLAVAVASAFVPGVPTGIVSLLGTGLYWWSTGFTEPGTLVLGVLVAISLLAVVADVFGGIVAANVGGASTGTTLFAGLVGAVLLVLTGPVAMVVGSAIVVFVLEYRRRADAGGSAVAAGAYVLGFFAAALAQALLAFTVFLTVLWVALF